MCVCVFLVQLEDLPLPVRVKVIVLGIFLSFSHNKFGDPSRDSNAHFRPLCLVPDSESASPLHTGERALERQATVLFI